METEMEIKISTDSHVAGGEALTVRTKSVVESALSRFRERITSVEVRLSDVNGGKSGQDDKRCMMEARLEGRHATVVTHQAATPDQAVDGAIHTLKRSIESALGRESTLAQLRDHR
jgi:sigma 54 modulation/S30EA-like ribosomal protein